MKTAIGEPVLTPRQYSRARQHNISPGPRQEIRGYSNVQRDSSWKSGRREAGHGSIQRKSDVPVRGTHSRQECAPVRCTARRCPPECKVCRESGLPPTTTRRGPWGVYRAVGVLLSACQAHEILLSLRNYLNPLEVALWGFFWSASIGTLIGFGRTGTSAC